MEIPTLFSLKRYAPLTYDQVGKRYGTLSGPVGTLMLLAGLGQGSLDSWSLSPPKVKELSGGDLLYML